MIKFIKLYPLFFLFALISKGQEGAIYNINKRTGLSSNHVYTTLVDKNGYLWIGTSKGLYRYNGYKLSKYDYSDGLSNLDIWDLYEDKQGRIWLKSIANGIGYIKDNVYIPVYVKNNNLPIKIYPSELYEIDSLIFFPNKHFQDDKSWSYVVIANDTAEMKSIPNDPLNFSRYQIKDNMVISSGTQLNVYPIKHIIANNEFGIPTQTTVPIINHNEDFAQNSIMGTYGSYYYTGKIKDSFIDFYNPFSNKLTKLSIGEIKKNNELLVHAYTKKNLLHVLTNYGVYEIDSLLNVVNTYPYDSLFKADLKKFNTTYFTKDPFWGISLSTSDNGLYINSNMSSRYKRSDLNLTDYEYISNSDDSSAYWWNENRNILAIVKEGKIIDSFHLKDMYKITKIIPFDSNKSLLLSVRNIKWLYKNGKLEEVLKGSNHIVYDNKSHIIENQFRYAFRSSYDGIVNSEYDFYFIGSGFFGLVHLYFDTLNGTTVHANNIYKERFEGIVNYPFANGFILYGREKIFIYNYNHKATIDITPSMLKSSGINHIEKIFSDSHGNVILKDYDRLFIFNPVSKKLSTIFDNYNLREAKINVSGNTISVAGTFGAIQCNSDVNGSIYNTKTYPNSKNVFYQYINDVQFSYNNILLKTDAGTYLIDTRADQYFDNSSDNYLITLNNNGHVFNVQTNDTVSITQTTNAINIDVIKPTGTGDLKIEYAIDGNDYRNSGFQILLPDLAPANYYTVSVIASDNSWISKPVKFYIYVHPQWWQTPNAKKVIFFLSILLLISLVYFIILLTRRIVNQNNDRRNQRRELELKSIYSQINPHFIFNSLSTAQYFVKKNMNKEAYEHINQFSDLLRAYIKSSRNKYISITEEIENLQNYLQLQLTRFEEKFEYQINIDKSINPNIVKIPSLLLQPIVENALNHGIFHNDKMGLLNISFTIDKNILICTVDDNGIGRKKSKEIRSALIQKASSYGTILIKELIDTFNKYEKIKIEIEYIDKQEPNTGTTVIIKIENFTYV